LKTFRALYWFIFALFVLSLVSSELFPTVIAVDSASTTEFARKLEIRFDQGYPSEWIGYVRDFYNAIYPELETFCGPPVRPGILLIKFDSGRRWFYYDRGMNAIVGGVWPNPSAGQKRDIWWDLSFAEAVSAAFHGPIGLFAEWPYGLRRAIANLVMMSLSQKGSFPVEYQNWVYAVKSYDAFNYLGGDLVAGMTWGQKVSGNPFYSLREGMFLLLAYSFPSKQTGQFDYLARVLKAVQQNLYWHKKIDLSLQTYYEIDRTTLDTALDEAADGQRIDGLLPSEWVMQQAVTLEKSVLGPRLGAYLDDVDNPWRITVFAFDRQVNPRNPREGIEKPLENLLVWLKVIDWKGEVTYQGNVTTGADGRGLVRPRWKMTEGAYAVFAEANYGSVRLSSRGYAINRGQAGSVQGPSRKLLGIVLEEEGEPISGSIKTDSGRLEFSRSGIFSIESDTTDRFEMLLSSNKIEKRFTKPANFARIVPISALGVGSDLRAVVWGKVTDAETNEPLPGAEVRVYRDIVQKGLTNTDSRGKYRVVVRGEDKYTLFTMAPHASDGSSIDYIPSTYAVDTKTSRNSSVNFRLHRAALIVLDKQLELLDLTRASSMNFTVLDGRSGRALDLNGTLCTYGDITRFLGLNVRYIKVPAGREIRLKVDVAGTYEETTFSVRITKVVTRSFVTDETFYLKGGEKTTLDLRRLSMMYNLQALTTAILKASELLQQAERFGFYVVAEKKDLTSVNMLSSSANEKLKQGKFDEGFSDAKEAHIKASYLLNSILRTFSESYWSGQALVFFLAFCASALAAFVFDKTAAKFVGIVGTYSALWLWLYYVFPGCGVIPLPILLISTAVALVGSTVLSLVLPAAFGKVKGSTAQLSTIFSLAKRNLRRRKLRTALLVTTMMTLVLSFVALTSFSVEYGLEIKAVSGVAPDGVLVRENPAFDVRFWTLAELKGDVGQWISEKEGVTKIVPKLESLPEIRITKIENYIFYDYLGRLVNPATNATMPLLGAVAIHPREEPIITQIQVLVTTGQLFDENEKAVMVTVDAAQKYGFRVGDQLIMTLSGKDGRIQTLPVTLTGFLDDEKLRATTDLDGESILPKFVYRTTGAAGVTDTMDYCETGAIVLLNTATAGYFPRTLSLSRLSVLPATPERIPVLARTIALARDLWTWASAGGKIQSIHLTSYLETRGGFLIVPLALVALNLGAAIYMAISERKRETNTLSTLGVNPSDITRLFLGEAIFIALLGAGIGYLSGLSFYKVASVFLLNPEVRQKISASWSVAVVILAVAVALLGAHIPSKKAAVFSTPMGLARWKMDEGFSELEGWKIRLPLKVETAELDGFMRFMFDQLEKLDDSATSHVERLKMMEEDSSHDISRTVEFRFMMLGKGELRSSFGTGGFFIARSQLIVSGKRTGPLNVELVCKVSKDAKEVAYQVADVLRKIALDWTTQRSGPTEKN